MRFGRPAHDGRWWLPGSAGLVLAAALCSVAPPAAGDIYKCTDNAGNVTYQNEKCPSGTKAGRVEIFDNNWTASRSEKDAQWQRNVADRRVVTGMPARWVREALGEPAETRETTTGGATELWLYNLPDRGVQIGMLDNQVLWLRETPVSVPVARIAPAPPATQSSSALTPATPAATQAPAASTPAAPAPRAIDILRAPEMRSLDAPRTPEAAPETSVNVAPRAGEAPRVAELPAPDATRRAARGRDCREVLAELGRPDRQREIPASEVTGTVAMTEYLYEPSGSSDPTRTRILCANGKVEGVDRSVAR